MKKLVVVVAVAAVVAFTAARHHAPRSSVQRFDSAGPSQLLITPPPTLGNSHRGTSDATAARSARR